MSEWVPQKGFQYLGLVYGCTTREYLHLTITKKVLVHGKYSVTSVLIVSRLSIHKEEKNGLITGMCRAKLKHYCHYMCLHNLRETAISLIIRATQHLLQRIVQSDCCKYLPWRTNHDNLWFLYALFHFSKEFSMLSTSSRKWKH